MNAPARRTDPADDMLAAYSEHCDDLGLGAPGKEVRLQAARRFLDLHGDLTAWTARPVPARLLDLRRVEGS
jgi:hypothetical protein